MEIVIVTKLTTKIGFVCLLVGYVMYLLGFASPYWVMGTDIHEGLWKYCRFYMLSSCGYFDMSKLLARWFRASQVFSAIGLTLITISLGIFIAHVFISKLNSTLVRRTGALSALGGGAFAIIGIIIFAVNFPENPETFHAFRMQISLAWAYVVAVIGASLTTVGGVLLII